MILQFNDKDLKRTYFTIYGIAVEVVSYSDWFLSFNFLYVERNFLNRPKDFVPSYTILFWKNSLSELRDQANIGKLFQITRIQSS